MEAVVKRRVFLAAAASAAMARAKPAWADRLGIMCHSGAAEEPARRTLAAARAAGFERIQLNLPWDKVDAAYLKALPGWVRAEGLRCDVLSAYVNCLEPAIVLMNTRRDDFARAIGYAREIGARRLIAWTGSHDSDLMKADERNSAPAAADRIVRFLEPFTPKLEAAELQLALETYITLACPDAPSLRRMLDRLPPCVGAVLDPPNLTPLSRFSDRDTALRDMVATLRDRVVVVHLKDFKLGAGGRGYELPGPLMGDMNYRLFSNAIGQLPPGIPVIAEHLQPAQFAEARRKLLAL